MKTKRKPKAVYKFREIDANGREHFKHSQQPIKTIQYSDTPTPRESEAIMIDMKTDYWKEFYRLKNIIESGKGTREDHRALNQARENAQAKADQLAYNWSAIGVTNR